MRILHWTELYRPNTGDVELLTEQLIGSLHARGHENIVVTSHTASALQDIEQRGPARVHRFRFQHALAAADGAAIDAIGREVSDLLSAISPEIIHVHTLGPSLFFLEQVMQGAWSTICTVHESGSRSRGALASRVLSRCDGIVATSNDAHAALREHLPALADKTLHARPGLPWPMRRAPSQEAAPLIVAVDRFVRGKGLDVLLRAMPAILRVFPDARLRIIGDGRERPMLEALAAELGLASEVEMSGWLSAARIEASLSRAHVVAAPACDDGAMGLIAIQAAQLGRPVVASAAGALREIVVDGVTGVLVAPRDSHALAWSTIELLAHPDRAARLGAAARDRASQHYAMPAMINAYEELYSSVSRERRRRAGSALSDRPLLVWEGPQSGYSAFAYANAAICGALLDSHGVDLRVASNQRTWSDIDTRPELQRLRKIDSAVAGLPLHESSARPSLWVRHQFPSRSHSPGRFPWVVFQPWEYSLLSSSVAELLGRCREVWVPSVFTAEAIRRSGVRTPVEVMPHGVDTTLFAPEGKTFSLPNEDAFRFLFVGASIYRKGLDVLLAAYARAFRRSENVVLVVKDMGVGSSYEGHTSGSRVEAFAADLANPRVAYLDGRLPPQSLASLYRSCDVFVSSYRGESFSLPTLEAMASGLPVLVTAGGATDDFVDESVGWRIPSRPRYVGRSVYGQPAADDVYLLEPDVDALAMLMRECFERRDEVKTRGAAALERVRGGWTWEHCAGRILERIDALTGMGAAARR